MDDDERYIDIRDDKEFAYAIRIPRKYSWAIHDGPNSPLCDLTLVMDEGRISVHSDVFTHLSMFFKAMLSASWIESKTHKVHFPNIEFRHMRSLVDMIYAKELLLTHYNIEPLFKIIHHLQMDQLVAYCTDVLIDSVTTENVVSLYHLAVRFDLKNLHEECLLYVLENCRELFENAEFLEEIPFEFVKEVVQHDGIFVKSELDVLTMILSWLQVDSNRDADKIALFEKVRFPQLNISCKKVLKALTPLLVDSTIYTAFCKSHSWLTDLPRYQLQARRLQPIHLHYVLKVNYVNFGKPNRAYALVLYCNIQNKLTVLHEQDHGKPSSYSALYGPHEHGEAFTVIGRYAYLQERMILRKDKREFLRLTRTNLQPNRLGCIQTQNVYYPVPDQSLFQVGRLVPDGNMFKRLHVTGSANRLSPAELLEIRNSLHFDPILSGLDNISVLEFDPIEKSLALGAPLIQNEAKKSESWLFALLADRMCKWIRSDEYSFILSSALDGLNSVVKIDAEGQVSRISFKPEVPTRRTARRGLHDILLVGGTLYTYEYLDTYSSGTSKVHRRIRAMDAKTEEFTGIMAIDAENTDATAKLLFSICEMDVNKLEFLDIRGRPHLLVVPAGYQLGSQCYFGVFEIIHEMAANGDSLKVKRVRLDKLSIDEFQKLPEDSCIKIEAAVVPVDLHPCEQWNFLHDQLHRIGDRQLNEIHGLRKFAI